MTRNASIIAVTSGKGGVGKTHISANLGVLFAKTGRRVCVIDADHGLANINLILGLPASNQPRDLFEPNFDPLSCMIQTEHGMDVLPSCSGISRHGNVEPPSKVQISLMLKKLKPHYDIILVDTAAGIDEGVRNYLSLADHALLIINSEPTSLTDAFGLVRRMKEVQPFYNVVINRVSNAASATSIYKRFAGAVRKYIGAQVGAIGYISEDSFMSAAVLNQTAVVSYSPSCLASQCLRRIVRTIARKLADEAEHSVEQTEGITNIPESKRTEFIHAEPALKESVLHGAPKTESDVSTEQEQAEGSQREASEIIEIEDVPAIPKFIQSEEIDTFDSWLPQMKQFFDRKTSTDRTREHRKCALMTTLGKICDTDPAFLADLEAMVVTSSDKNSDSIIEQAALADRLAKTRFVEEPTIEANNNRLRVGGVSRAFSIISKLK
ncbi:MAG: AAA family ATPase [Kangiellaceae bacterium]|nr:AAA family ATPase [Kangiellaceae bacterium]